MSSSPVLWGLGVLLDDQQYASLFKELLSDEDATTICSLPYVNRKRSYVFSDRRDSTVVRKPRDEELMIAQQGTYDICWDRQQRAAMIAAHSSAADLEDASVSDFTGCLDDLAAAVEWLLPMQQHAAAAGVGEEPCIVHLSQGGWKRSRRLHFKAFLDAGGYVAATQAWRLPDVGAEEALRSLNVQDLRYHTKLHQYHNNHAPVSIPQEEKSSFFSVDLSDAGRCSSQEPGAAAAGSSSSHPPAAAEAPGAAPSTPVDAATGAAPSTPFDDATSVAWLGSRSIPGIFATRASSGLLNGFTTLEVREQIVRMKAYLASHGLLTTCADPARKGEGYCFFMVPCFHGASSLATAAAPPASPPQQQQQTLPPSSSASIPASCPPPVAPAAPEAPVAPEAPAASAAPAAPVPASALQQLFIRGFKHDWPGIVEELVQAVEGLGVQGCSAENVDLMSDRLYCRNEGAALLSLPTAADVERVQQLSGRELWGGRLYVAGGWLPQADDERARNGGRRGRGGRRPARDQWTQRFHQQDQW